MIKMMRRRDKPLKKQGPFSCTVLLLSSVFLLMTSCTPAPELPDYGLFEDLRDYSIQTFEGAGLVERSDTPDIFTSEYILDLKGLIRLVFGAPQLEVYLFFRIYFIYLQHGPEPTPFCNRRLPALRE